MQALVLGASGATGKRLVNELLNKDVAVKIIVRDKTKIEEPLLSHKHLEVIEAEISSMSVEEMKPIVQACSCVFSCLGHNLSFKGLYGHPRMLVTDACRLVCEVISALENPNKVKFILMNSSGNTNRDLQEKIDFKEKVVLSLIRNLVPPHRDNEKASDYLRTEIGRDHQFVEWSIVRPDSLIEKDKVSAYDIYQSPIRSAIFNPGQTSRINVANFMAQLSLQEELWKKWRYEMPVIYNQISSSDKNAG